MIKKKAAKAKKARGMRNPSVKTLGAEQARRVRGGAAETPTERAARLAILNDTRPAGDLSAHVGFKTPPR
jgi:hypothetical protein